MGRPAHPSRLPLLNGVRGGERSPDGDRVRCRGARTPCVDVAGSAGCLPPRFADAEAARPAAFDGRQGFGGPELGGWTFRCSAVPVRGVHGREVGEQQPGGNGERSPLPVPCGCAPGWPALTQRGPAAGPRGGEGDGCERSRVPPGRELVEQLAALFRVGADGGPGHRYGQPPGDTAPAPAVPPPRWDLSEARGEGDSSYGGLVAGDLSGVPMAYGDPEPGEQPFAQLPCRHCSEAVGRCFGFTVPQVDARGRGARASRPSQG
jgi:hypothetical protein